METDRDSILSALFESIAIDISMISDEIKRTALEPGQICASGGGTRNEVLLGLIATVLDRELLVCPQEYDSASGAGLIALSAFSESSLSEVVDKIKEICHCRTLERIQRIHFREEGSLQGAVQLQSRSLFEEMKFL